MQKRILKIFSSALLLSLASAAHARNSQPYKTVEGAILLEIGLETTPARKQEDASTRDALLESHPTLGMGIKFQNPQFVISVIPKIGFSAVGVSLDPSDAGIFRSLRLGVESLLHLDPLEQTDHRDKWILGIDYNFNKVRGEANYKDASLKIGLGGRIRDWSPDWFAGLCLKIGKAFYPEGSKYIAGIVLHLQF